MNNELMIKFINVIDVSLILNWKQFKVIYLIFIALAGWQLNGIVYFETNTYYNSDLKIILSKMY